MRRLFLLSAFTAACAGGLEDQINEEEQRAEAAESGLAERIAVLEAQAHRAKRQDALL